MSLLYSGLGFPSSIMRDAFISLNNAVSVGWSYGGLKAIRDVWANPKKRHFLILIASSPCFLQKPNWPGIPEASHKKFKSMVEGDPLIFANYYLRLVLYPRTKGLKELPLNKIRPSQIEDLFQSDLRKMFALLSCPICVIHGEKDPVIPSNVALELKNLNSRVQVTLIKEAGHAPFLSHKKEVQGIINDFISQ